MELKGYQRSYLTKKAHDMQPSVMIGGNGLTEAVIRQTEDMLEQHELIKVRFQDYKSSRKDLSRELVDKTDATFVRLIGNVAIIFREARMPEHRQIDIPSS